MCPKYKETETETLMMVGGSGMSGIGFKSATRLSTFSYQPPAVLDQAAPVVDTYYAILDTEEVVRIHSIVVNIEDTNETLEVKVTVNGEVLDPYGAACTHSKNYYGWISPNAIDQKEYLALSDTDFTTTRSFLIEAKGITVEVQKTTEAGTGNLMGIVIWSKKELV